MKTDTSKFMEKLYLNMIMSKTSEERLKMGFSMFDSAKKIVISSIKDNSNINKELFLRFYGDDFDDETKEKIINRL
jgi:hypothetical protein